MTYRIRQQVKSAVIWMGFFITAPYALINELCMGKSKLKYAISSIVSLFIRKMSMTERENCDI